MASKKSLSTFEDHIARATASAPTLDKMSAAWGLIAQPVSNRVWKLLIDQALSEDQALIVGFLARQGKLSDPDVAGLLWSAAAMCRNRPIIDEMLQSGDLVELIRQDQSGKFLSVFGESAFNDKSKWDDMSRTLEIGLHQDALDKCLAKILVKSIDASGHDRLGVAWDMLLAAGASPLAKGHFPGKNNSDPASREIIAFGLAKRAYTLPGNGSVYLASMVNHCDIARVLEFTDRAGRSFAPMWVGGKGDTQALIQALDAAAAPGCRNWWDGDPFHVFPDALRLACVCNDPVLFEHLCLRASAEKLNNPLCDCAIAPIVNQAYRQSLLASSGTRHGSGWEVEGGVNSWKIVYGNSGSSLPKSDAPDYSFHINFWAKQAPSLATLFANPNQWKRACAIIAKSLPHVTKPTNSRIQSLVDGLELEFGSPPVDPTRKSSLRL